MKKAKLERFETTDEGTFGKLYIDGKFVFIQENYLEMVVILIKIMKLV